MLLQHGLDEFVAATHLYRPLRLLARLPTFGRDEATRSLPRGQRIREALQELGPIFVKFGQAISTRRDLLPPDIADELAKLQDEVPPFPGGEARRLAGAAYERPVTEVFASFDDTPIAAASIAQVHGATLADGREVAVKIQYPGADEALRADLKTMRRLTSVLKQLASGADVQGVVDELVERTEMELDYRLEADEAMLSVRADRSAVPGAGVRCVGSRWMKS